MLHAENQDLKAKIKADLGVDAGDRDWLPCVFVCDSDMLSLLYMPSCTITHAKCQLVLR